MFKKFSLEKLIAVIAQAGLVGLVAACSGGGGSGGGSTGGPGPGGAGLSILAGNMGGTGSANGMGKGAGFDAPYAVATDSSGNVYVTDQNNFTIRKISPAGLVTTLAGSPGVAGSTDGSGAAATFDTPAGIATDLSGNVYVADQNNNTIRKITPAGVVSTLAGSPGVTGYANGNGAAASFNSPCGIATDGNGNIYVADQNNNAIRKITPSGDVSTLADNTTGSMFNFPSGVAIDSAGNVYVADQLNNEIKKVAPSGAVTTLAGSPAAGSADGPGVAARFRMPTGVATDPSGNVYVADQNNGTIRKVTPAGVVSTLAGSSAATGFINGPALAATFDSPTGVAVDSSGNIYVADQGNDIIRKISPAFSVSTFAGTATVTGSSDGIGEIANFDSIGGIAADIDGNVYVSDQNNDTIRKITPAGVVSTIAGTATVAGSNDGIGPQASFDSPGGIALDGFGNIYVSDQNNDTIRKISPSGYVSTLAGSAGTAGSNDGAGSQASFDNPNGIAVDSSGNVYVADQNNDTIRKISPVGVVSTLAGTAGNAGSDNGVGSAASFDSPDGLALDSSGNIYVSDQNGNTIRKIIPDGTVTSLAGNAYMPGTSDGTGSAARFNFPSGIAIDGSGNIYVADMDNHTIRKVTPSGSVTTIAGMAGKPGFTPGALPGQLNYPVGVALSGRTLYIANRSGVAAISNVP